MKNNDTNKPAQNISGKEVETPQQNQKERSNNYKGRRAPLPVLGEKAEDYLDEVANIEDMPDENDQADYDKKIAETKKEQNKKHK